MQRKILFLLGILLCANFAVEGFTEGGRMKVTSPAFKNSAYLPQRFSCDGDGVNPALEITGIPAQAQSLALIVDDPDAPIGTYVHWVVFDIPVVALIEENSVPGKQGVNTGGRKDYVSPCPPSGTHRYFFKVYALDTLLNLEEGISKGALEKAMQGHILDQAQIIGLCKR
ncbi:MAG: YbhB/YbcL family Raf kinase inhibitor-like protein [Candidatus Omnitrophica bacterium]|nr:YbhB/YbcL family Raf kinase inhibitor-like protein [Candidatus Omnitrophota bacterium]